MIFMKIVIARINTLSIFLAWLVLLVTPNALAQQPVLEHRIDSASIKTGRIQKPAVRADLDRAEKLWQLLHQVYQNLQGRMQEHNSVTAASQILERVCEVNDPKQYLVQALREEAKHKKNSHGLSARGAYTSSNIDNSDGDGNAYLELSWDVLEQGYKANQRKAEYLQREASITQLRAQMENHKQRYACRSMEMAKSFNGLESSLITLKLELMEPVYELERRAYFRGWSFLDDLLVSEQDLRLARGELKYLHSDPYWNNTFSAQTINPPLIDINMPAVLASIEADDTLVQVSLLERQSLMDSRDYRRKNRLRLFLRKEFEVGDNDDDGVVAGVRFTIPFEKQRNKKSLSYRLRQLDEENELQTWERVARTRAAYESLREQQKRVIKQQYRYLRSQERVRRIFAHQQPLQELELAAAVARVRSLLDASIELVRAKEELYRRVNQVLLVARVEYRQDLVEVIAAPQQQQRARNGNRHVYLWSKAFNAVNNKQIFDFLEVKAINKVLLSGGRKADRNKVREFIRQSADRDISVDLIIGSNKWIFPENHKRAATVIATMVETAGSIHLDIEPHTLDGYKSDRERYLKHYIEMLQQARAVIPQRPLTVSVPVHWPGHVYKQIAELADKVYIMSYGSSNAETIVRRSQSLLANIPVEKLVYVLRVADFDDEWAMEKVIDVLQLRTGVNHFGFHQFRSFFEMAGSGK